MPHHRTVGTPDRLAAVAQNHCWGGGRESAGTPNTDHCPNIPTLQPFAATALESPQHTCRYVQISHTRQWQQAEVCGRDALSQASARVNIKKSLGRLRPSQHGTPLRHHRLLPAGSSSPASHCPLAGSSATPHPLITRVSSAARPQCLQIGWVANRRWVGGRSTAECARDERARARQRAFSHQTMSIYPPCSCAPARPPAVPCVPVTVRAPFEDQPCPRGTKRNNRQIKVGQSARSLRVAQLSKRAC